MTLESTKRWHIAIEASLILFLCSAGVGCFIAHANQADVRSYITVVGVPACASALFVAISCFFAHVIEQPDIRFPLNLTLPTIFCCLLPVASVLISTPERGLLAMQDNFAYALVWRHPVNLMIVFLGQVTALSLFAVLSRRST